MELPPMILVETTTIGKVPAYEIRKIRGFPTKDEIKEYGFDKYDSYVYQEDFRDGRKRLVLVYGTIHVLYITEGETETKTEMMKITNTINKILTIWELHKKETDKANKTWETGERIEVRFLDEHAINNAVMYVPK